ncbi:MAG: glycosyltransferase, partial [Henriciella sp.]
YDAARLHEPDFWKHMSLVRVISFCRTMHNELQDRFIDTNYFQFFPDPAKYVPAADRPDREGGPRGYVWLRRPWDGVTWDQARSLIQSIGSSSAQVHLAHDNDYEGDIERPSEADIAALNLDVSDWFSSKEEYLSSVRGADYFIAPRYFEGIGFSVLEAMSMGLCPVSADEPTMNEYIFHGENGLFFDRSKVSELPSMSVEELRRLGVEARKSVERGRERWMADRDRLLDRLLHVSRPPSRWTDYSAQINKPSATDVSSARPGVRSRGGKSPKLTVVTVVRDDIKGLRKTMQSLVRQDFQKFEYLVIDGERDASTLEKLGDLAGSIDTYINEVDEGPYDAMQKAAELAQGDFVYYLNAGDTFYAEDSLGRMVDAAGADVDVVYGDHIWLREDGRQVFKRARHFAQTWNELSTGEIGQEWLDGIPAQQATMVRRDLLVDHKFDLRFLIAADHELLFRTYREGARFRHCQDVVAIYAEGGMSSLRFERCKAEWFEIAMMYGNGPGIQAFYGPALGFHATANPSGRGRNRVAELAGVVARKLDKEGVTYKTARSLWRKLRAGEKR